MNDTPPNTDSSPSLIRLRRQSRILEVAFDEEPPYELSFEFLRVHSPSAEVKGHGPGQETLVLGKQSVQIERIEPVGQYAIRLVFDDGHDSGLFSWKYLRELGQTRDMLWTIYLAKVLKI
ncbi:MAG: DUF971 domain-containing protein [Gammaproteobacteria bacterium]|nr:DUF971 domain-containing protein [Gammaproteobacteria bacterium]